MRSGKTFLDAPGSVFVSTGSKIGASTINASVFAYRSEQCKTRSW
jgi:hypothetical protein